MQEKVEKFKSYLEQDPNNINLLFELVDCLLEFGKKDEAQAYLERGLVIDSRHAGLRFAAASIAIANKNMGDAECILEELLKDGFDNLGVRYNLALSLLAQTKPTESFEALNPIVCSVISLQELDVSVLVLMARIYHHLAEMGRAIEMIEVALSLEPTHAEANAVASLLFLDLENNSRAKECALIALEFSVQANLHIEPMIVLGSLSLMDQKVEEADAFFIATLEKDSKSGRGNLGRGMVFMLKNQLVDAEIYLTKALESISAHIGSWITLAWNQIAQQKIKEAQESVNRAMSIDRNFAETHGTQAVLHFLRGDFNDCRTVTKVALRLNPISFAANYAQSLLLKHDNKKNQSDMLVQGMLSMPFLEGEKSLNDVLINISLHQNVFHNTQVKDKGNSYER